MTKRTTPDRAILVARLTYDPDTGEFLWKQNSEQSPEWNSKYAGKVAGHLRRDGYRTIKIDDTQYYAHRLAHKMMTNTDAWEIDHRDGDPSNMQWSNLRAAPHLSNIHNSTVLRRVLPRGVYRANSPNGYIAQIIRAGVQMHLGTFKSPEEAHDAYCAAALRFSGDFANTSTKEASE